MRAKKNRNVGDTARGGHIFLAYIQDWSLHHKSRTWCNGLWFQWHVYGYRWQRHIIRLSGVGTESSKLQSGFLRKL